MTRHGATLRDQALDAAADLLLSDMPEGPPSPPIQTVCKAAGIGASKFYRLFGDKENYQIRLAAHDLWSSYELLRQVVATELSLQLETAEDAETAASASELVRELSAAGSAMIVSVGVSEGSYLPWIDNPNIQVAMRDGLEREIDATETLARDLFLATGDEVDEDTQAAGARVILMASVAADLVLAAEEQSVCADACAALATGMIAGDSADLSPT